MPWLLLAAAVVAVPLVWLLGDLLYALAVRWRYARWEKGIERDAEGVRAGCREGTLGAGDVGLLLVHGFGDSPAIFVNLAPALAAEGLQVRTLRLPGHGLPMDRYRLLTDSGQWRKAVQDALGELRTCCSRVVLVAHSMGAAVALDALAGRPELADGLVLLAPLIDVSRRRSPFLHPRTWFALVDPLLLFTDRVAMIFPLDLHDKEALALARADRFVPRAVFRELFAVVARIRGRAKEFNTPLLVWLAKEDLVIDNAAARRFFEEYGGPKSVQIAEGSGHMLPLDHDWRRIAADVAGFAREVRDVSQKR
jgi:carboxylesterase